METKTIKETIPISPEDNIIYNIVTKNVNRYTHGFHKYPGKFIPQIPSWAINRYLKGKQNQNILDPFCGSGTTLIESLLQGHCAIGLDVDPLSALISKVKTTSISKTTLTEISEWLTKYLEDDLIITFVPACETINHWFTDDAILKLSKIRSAIDKISITFGKSKKVKDVQDLLIICFSSIIRKVSNADNQSQKTYVSHTKIKTPEEVNQLFSSQLEYFINRSIEFTEQISNNSKVEIFNKSCIENLNLTLSGKKIDLIITSPPYIKAIDYVYNQMAELFWIGDKFGVQTQQRQNRIKQHYVGNKQILKVEYSRFDPIKQKFGIPELDKTIYEIFKTDLKNGHKHAYITYKYFHEMESHFTEIRGCIAPKINYVMVVGNSDVSGIHVETASFLSLLAERNGFKLTNQWGYKIKNRFMRFNRKGRGGIIKIDWVMTLESV